MEHITHTFGPCFDRHCKILILGTMPSPKSREQGFYYGHPQNAFWTTLAQVLSKEAPEASPEARREFALENHVSLWDVLDSCDIRGAEDSSICNEVPNDLALIFAGAPEIQRVFTTGKKAKALYDRYRRQMYQNCRGQKELEGVYLPSTSPANRAQQKTELYWQLWSQVREALI